MHHARVVYILSRMCLVPRPKMWLNLLVKLGLRSKPTSKVAGAGRWARAIRCSGLIHTRHVRSVGPTHRLNCLSHSLASWRALQEARARTDSPVSLTLSFHRSGVHRLAPARYRRRATAGELPQAELGSARQPRTRTRHRTISRATRSQKGYKATAKVECTPSMMCQPERGVYSTRHRHSRWRRRRRRRMPARCLPALELAARG